jgi:hypothetical protein
MDDISGVTVRPLKGDERTQTLDPLRRTLGLYKQRLPESVARAVEDLQDLGKAGVGQVERCHRPSRNITHAGVCSVLSGIGLTGAIGEIALEAHADVWQTVSAESTEIGRNSDYSQPEVRRSARVISTRRNWVRDFACLVAASSRILAWSQSLLTPSPLA